MGVIEQVKSLPLWKLKQEILFDFRDFLFRFVIVLYLDVVYLIDMVNGQGIFDADTVFGVLCTGI